MSSYIGLYYPFIIFKDDAWLKLTALYWDKMGRIVPRGYQTRDSDTVKKLAGELDFIINCEPEIPGLSKLAIKFNQLLQGHKNKLLKRYDVSKRENWPVDPIVQASSPHWADPRLGYIFNQKIPPDLQEALFETGLALPDRGGDPRWIGMHPKMAHVYMAALAEEIAKDHGFHAVTDEFRDHLAVDGWTMERLAQALLEERLLDNRPSGEEIEERMVRLAFKSVIPIDIANVPTEKIIEFRRKYPGELASFQELVKKSIKELCEAEISDREKLDLHLQNINEKYFKPKTKELRQQLLSVGINSTVGALLVSSDLPAIASVLLGLFGVSAGSPIAGAVGIALGLTKVYFDRSKSIHDARRGSQVSWLLRLEENLQPRGLISWLAGDTEKFFLGV